MKNWLSHLRGNQFFLFVRHCEEGFARRGNLNINTSSPDLLKARRWGSSGKIYVIELNYWRITFATHCVSCRVMTWGV